MKKQCTSWPSTLAGRTVLGRWKPLQRGVNRGIQIRRSVQFCRQIRRSANIFFFKFETTITSGKINVNAIVTSNFARIVNKATCSMTITEYNSNNSLTPEFKWVLFEKRNNLDELINIPTKAEERSMIQISFRTQDPNIKTGTIRNQRQNPCAL